jgi:hypothetical protein
MNRPSPDSDPLAQWAGRTLRQLPGRPAPRDFAPRVLAEIRRQSRLPWYRRPWLQWSATQRWCSALLLPASLYACFGLLLPFVGDLITRHDYFRYVLRVTDGAQILFNATGRIAQTIHLALGELTPSVWYTALGLAGFVWCCSLGLGTACWRIARTSR